MEHLWKKNYLTTSRLPPPRFQVPMWPEEKTSPSPATDETGTQVGRNHSREPILKSKWLTPGV